MLMDEQFAIDVLSGRRRGIIPTALRSACRVASWGYTAGMTLRNAAYDHGWLKTHRVDCPVISIGNITTGGTGKTPLVAWFAQRLQHAGYRPGILSRGYRSLDGATNDESLVLERLCPGVAQVAMRDRVAGAAKAISLHRCDALVLDDGFQHRRLARDLDVVLIDALQPWGYGHLLPRGLLREVLSALKRADVVIITRADQVTEDILHELRTRIALVRGVDEHIAMRFTPKRLMNALGEARQARGSHQRWAAFCGIGNPDGFRRTLNDLGMDGELKTFPDHHHYSRADLDGLAEWSAAHSVSEFATTLKDLVKIPTDHPLAAHIWAVEIATEFVAGEQHLVRHLASLLKPQKAKLAA